MIDRPAWRLQLLFEREGLPSFDLPEPLRTDYGGGFGLPERCLYANFVASVDGVVALRTQEESGHIISGGSEADRFVMGLLRACAGRWGTFHRRFNGGCFRFPFLNGFRYAQSKRRGRLRARFRVNQPRLAGFRFL